MENKQVWARMYPKSSRSLRTHHLISVTEDWCFLLFFLLGDSAGTAKVNCEAALTQSTTGLLPQPSHARTNDMVCLKPRSSIARCGRFCGRALVPCGRVQFENLRIALWAKSSHSIRQAMTKIRHGSQYRYSNSAKNRSLMIFKYRSLWYLSQIFNRLSASLVMSLTN